MRRWPPTRTTRHRPRPPPRSVRRRATSCCAAGASSCCSWRCSSTAWLHAFGTTATTVITIASGVLSVVLWIVIRPPVQWRRLPWFVVAYVLWATLSLLWSAWPATTALTLILLCVTTIQALFIGSVLTWRELVRAAASALKWVMGLSLVFELWVSVFVRRADPARASSSSKADDPIEYWSRNNLFDGRAHPGHHGQRQPARPRRAARDHRVRDPLRRGRTAPRAARRLDRRCRPTSSSAPRPRPPTWPRSASRSCSSPCC